MSYKNYFSNKNDTYKDWETDTVHEKISPKFNDNDKDYYLSMKDVIEGINTSKYPLSGENV